MLGRALSTIIGQWQISLAILAASLLALGGVYVKGRGDGQALERARWEALEAKAAKIGAQANEDAHKAVSAGRDKVRAENDAARAAAGNSGDPLKAGMDKLREGK